jgi:uncharacterized membrane protein
MKGNDKTVKLVAIIGAGAAGKHALWGVIFLLTRFPCIGSVTAAAFAAEQYFDVPHLKILAIPKSQLLIIF